VAANGARNQFSRAFSCPESRIEVSPAEGLDPAPPEIAADPERLEVWRRNHVDGRARLDLRGCGQSLRFACSVLAKSVFCLPVSTPLELPQVTSATGVTASLDGMLQKAMQTVHDGRARLGIAYSSTIGPGLLVRAVLAGGPSDGKLLPGDVIVGAGDDPTDDKVALDQVVQAHAGKSLALSVVRGGARRTISVDVPRP
jgi:hypothetical protein